MDDTTALQLMSEFNEKKTGGEPWSETELQHKLNDAKRIVSSAGEFGSRVTESRDSGDGINLKFVAQQVTDMGNAARLVLRHGDSIRYSHPHKKWYVWDGRRWQQDHRGKIVLRSKSVALSIFDEAKAADSDERRKRLADWGVASQTRDRLNAMATLAQPDVAIEPSEMDRDPWAFNCLNGTIDLRTGLLRPHRREDLITKLAEVHFDPDAKAPLFAAFLERALGGDQELITFIQRLFGHCLTADVREQYLFVFHGEGGNGKNVLLDTISAIMGDYAAEAPPDLVTTRRNPEHPTEIANLMGQRLVVASETEHGSELRTQLIKRLTGNAWLKARLMRKDFFQFERTHKLILVTNNRPVLREDTEAVWRRIRLVPFNVVVPLEERDPELLQKLKQESSGILAWMVRGCQDWIAHGLAAPHAVMAATSEYRSNSSGIQAFIEQHCVLDPNAWSSAESLCARYLSWCARNRFVPLQGKELGAALRSQRCTDKKRGGVRGWFGIGLRSESLDGMDGMDGMDGRIRLSAL
ncbi:MAG: phage/plasmid primase, P4 family [Phycisphaerae bacterium]